MNETILAKGAEAIILLDKKGITKRRTKKSYRIPEVDDRIRKLRTRSEAKLLDKASKFIPTPDITKADEKAKEIRMEFIDGKKLSDHLDKFPLKKQKEICMSIGENVANLHDADMIHGDLTTSNMILVENKKIVNKVSELKVKSALGGGGVVGELSKYKFKIYFIDFGLGFNSHKFEDKAVDLHLLRQALEAKHFKHWEFLFKEVLKSYSKSKDYKIVLERLKAVEKRGRYKH